MKSATNTSLHAANPVSAWVAKHAARVRQGGSVLDLAAGSGRHTRFFLDRGNRVMAVDLNVGGLDDLQDHPDLAVLEADLENGPWPLGNAQFDGIVVTNYLWRTLFAHIEGALAPGGVLIYETFAEGNEQYGKPSNPDFLLREGELKEAFAALNVIEYEHGYVDEPRPAMVQRICAIKPDQTSGRE